VLYLLLALGIPAICLSAVLGYYYVVFSRLVDTQLHGERERVLPRVFARPLELRAGQHLNERQLIDRLNDLGYAERATAEHPGEFAITREGISLVPRTGRAAGRTVRAVFRGTPAVVAAGSARTTGGGRLDRLEMAGTGRLSALTLDAPLLTALIAEGRQKRRQVPLKMIPKHLVNAVLAIEDKRFYYHPGVDAIGAFGALVTNIKGDHPYLAGGSTITQQLVRNVFLGSFLANPLEKSLRRKLLEQWMAVVLERRASKDEVLELYLNEVYLGQRGSFAIHGVAEAARLFFGKDVANLTLAEAATIAGVIQSPHAHSPFASAARARPRRNVVLGAMADAGFITKQAADQAGREPLSVVSRALEAEAPYFVDLVGQTLSQSYPALVRTPQSIDVYTTLDLHLQRLAQDAVRDGLAQVDALLARRSRRTGPAQAALIAVDPRTGEILALVGGRSYNQSQYNRATVARRQPGSVFKPFVYLAAFERAAAEGRTDITPATVVNDEPTTFYYEDKEWSPGNYQNEYEGWITLREALAHSRNAATAKVAEMIGFDQVAALWNRVGTATPPKPYPSIALGVFEATPLEVATAYTIFPALGELRAFQSILRIMSGEREIVGGLARATKHIARPETTFLVLNMMRSVINEGTGAGARAAGFTLDAAGKTGTTNDLRDAWFAGFTPELLTVVWVGFDDNQALGLSGSQAALPIWSAFMIRALAGHANAAFEVPDGITFVEIDRDTGKLALPGCPRVVREAFVSGTEPTESCDLHRQ
jgi:penicillin-binding protein 1B